MIPVKTMAEVLAEHSVAGMSGGTHLACRCDRTWVRHHEYRDHIEAALSAAGFGLVTDAKAEALLTMADRLEKARDMTWNGSMRKVNGWASAADFLRQHAEQAAS